MLAFMAYYPPVEPFGTSDDKEPLLSQRNPSSKMTDARNAASDEEVPPQSALSVSTEASSRAGAGADAEEEEDQDDHEEEHHGTAHRVEDDPRPSFGHYLQQMEDVPRIYMEKIYENTVHGPCQTVSLCEVNHMDLFSVRYYHWLWICLLSWKDFVTQPIAPSVSHKICHFFCRKFMSF